MSSSGSLRERIRIEAPPSTSDGMGGVVQGWTTIATDVPARIAPTRGGEEVRAARLSGIALFTIVVRSSDETRPTTAACRVVNERTGQTYNIKWVANLDERDRFLTMTAEAGGLVDG